jgi:peptide-methionine (S)-S-oxide reductase
MFLFNRGKHELPTPDTALPGRSNPILPNPAPHRVLGTPIAGPYPEGFQIAEFALGCFWGEEKTFWEQPGVWTGKTGHAETVRVVFDPSKTSYEKLLKVFWENHDPTQGMRQGNDVGTEYRSEIFVQDEAQRAAAEASKEMYQEQLTGAGYTEITTQIVGPPAPPFYFAEDYHQQYLDRVPNGYCPNHSTGITLPEGFAVTPLQYAE